MSSTSIAAASLLQAASTTPLPGTSSTAPTASTTAESAAPVAASPSASQAAASAAAIPSSAAPAAEASEAAAQAAQGAQEAQMRAEQEAQVFNAPPLQLPDNASTKDVLVGLAGAMADPTVNESTAQRLFQFHEQLFAAEKAMTQAIVDGMMR